MEGENTLEIPPIPPTLKRVSSPSRSFLLECKETYIQDIFKSDVIKVKTILIDQFYDLGYIDYTCQLQQRFYYKTVDVTNL